MITIEQLLRQAVRLGAADVLLEAGKAPKIRKNGSLTTMRYPDLSLQDIRKIMDSLLDDTQQNTYRMAKNVHFSKNIKGIGSFRFHISTCMGNPVCIIRVLGEKLPGLDSFSEADLLKKLCAKESGLVVIAGKSGSGKSTTLYSMLEYKAKHDLSSMVTVEKPVERIMDSDGGFIVQHEIGKDVESYASALHNVQYEAAELFVIGNLEDEEAVSAAVKAVQMGYLVFATMNAASQKQAQKLLESHVKSCALTEAALSKEDITVLYQELVFSEDGKISVNIKN